MNLNITNNDLTKFGIYNDIENFVIQIMNEHKVSKKTALKLLSYAFKKDTVKEIISNSIDEFLNTDE